MNWMMFTKTTLMISLTCIASAVWAKETVLAQAGAVQMIERNCKEEPYACDYLVRHQGKETVLISDWSKTAKAYQFSPKLIGFQVGATGIAHLLTVYDDQGNQKEFFQLMGMNAKQQCFVTEEQIKKDQHKIVFYRLPSLKPYLTLNQQSSGMQNYSRTNRAYFDHESGEFILSYPVSEDGEAYDQLITVQQPCSLNPKVLVDEVE
ncbi:hypothetical protein EC844_11487 [Acinetobacter calcoaceticus]|uniref:Uncharacterized protein n=1 Tax=Acinetobacter calcoaceticus TaxID=471 RepID=A0A4R1XRZ1_ACICA|nr:hypothetical protein EC844_11487 [Acinetobacter calcoaceticus]